MYVLIVHETKKIINRVPINSLWDEKYGKLSFFALHEMLQSVTSCN